MNLPLLFADGSCRDCIGTGGLCAYHKSELHWRERRLAAAIKATIVAQKESNIQAIMSRFELESDEVGTAYEKATRIYNAQIHALETYVKVK